MSAVRKVLAVVVTLVAALGAVRLVAPATSAEGEPPGVRQQLAFLRERIEAGADTDAQALFPEGYFFLNALYGLTWVDLGRRGVAPERAADEAAWALARMESPEGRAPFDPSASPPYGVFHAGWTTWLRGGLLTLRDDPRQRARFDAGTAALAAAFDEAPSPFLTAYPGRAWPCDSTVAIASLRLAGDRYAPVVDRWVARARTLLDPATGLLPHEVDPVTGAPLTGARGTSQAIIQRFLVDVDPELAREQYLLFRDRFLDRPLGLTPAVREYPRGVDGRGDVDSGPLVLGISLSTTVVTLGAAQVQGDHALAGALAGFGELAGVPVATPTSKRYALGVLPVGDAFLAWSKTAVPWTVPPPEPPAAVVGPVWRVPLLLLLAVVGVLPWVRVRTLVARVRRRWTAEPRGS